MSKITRKRVIAWFIPIILSVFISGCGSGDDPILGTTTTTTTSTTTIAPTVVAVAPANDDINVSRNLQIITAEFSIDMLPATLNPTTFTLLKGFSTVPETEGNVTYANRVAELALTSNLDASTIYTATITTGATSADGIALANNFVWTFTTGTDLDTTPPYVFSTSPRDGDLNVSITKIITATFSEAMKPLSITATAPATFSVMETNTSLNVDGNVSYSVINKIASFDPTSDLVPDTNYTATITTVAKDLAGNAMASDYNWTFVTASSLVTPPFVDFGFAETFAIASTAGITNTGATTIDGDVVLNPNYTCNGSPLTDSINGTFTGCAGDVPTLVAPHVVISPIYQPTTTAQSITDDLRVAYLEIKGKTGETLIAAPTTLGTGSTGQSTFAPGVYTTGSSSSIGITGDLTLNGGPNDTFVFKSWSTIDMAVGAKIILTGGAKASNVYWLAGSSASLLANSVWNGNLLAYASISMGTGATSCGRLFAGASTDGAFTFLANKVAVPGQNSIILAPAVCE